MIALLVLLIGLVATPAEAAPRRVALDLSEVSVVDGDTFDVGTSARYRPLGYDTPEIEHAKCPAERAAGERARQRLRDLMLGAERLEAAPARQPWPLDRYGRRLARVFVDGRDLADIFVSEGLARPYSGGRRGDWCGPDGALLR